MLAHLLDQRVGERSDTPGRIASLPTWETLYKIELLLTRPLVGRVFAFYGILRWPPAFGQSGASVNRKASAQRLPLVPGVAARAVRLLLWELFRCRWQYPFRPIRSVAAAHSVIDSHSRATTGDAHAHEDKVLLTLPCTVVAQVL